MEEGGEGPPEHVPAADLQLAGWGEGGGAQDERGLGDPDWVLAAAAQNAPVVAEGQVAQAGREPQLVQEDALHDDGRAVGGDEKSFGNGRWEGAEWGR